MRCVTRCIHFIQNDLVHELKLLLFGTYHRTMGIYSLFPKIWDRIVLVLLALCILSTSFIMQVLVRVLWAGTLLLAARSSVVRKDHSYFSSFSSGKKALYVDIWAFAVGIPWYFGGTTHLNFWISSALLIPGNLLPFAIPVLLIGFYGLDQPPTYSCTKWARLLLGQFIEICKNLFCWYPIFFLLVVLFQGVCVAVDHLVFWLGLSRWVAPVVHFLGIMPWYVAAVACMYEMIRYRKGEAL